MKLTIFLTYYCKLLLEVHNQKKTNQTNAQICNRDIPCFCFCLHFYIFLQHKTLLRNLEIIFATDFSWIRGSLEFTLLHRLINSFVTFEIISGELILVTSHIFLQIRYEY